MITIPNSEVQEKHERKEALLLMLRDMTMELVALDTDAVDKEMTKLN